MPRSEDDADNNEKDEDGENDGCDYDNRIDGIRGAGAKVRFLARQ